MPCVYENSKESISRDLEQLAVLLNVHNFCKDTSSLYQASKLEYNDGDNWKYEIDIPITVNTIPSHIRPIEIECLDIRFSLNIEGMFLPEDALENPLSNLKFDIVIQGLSTLETYIATWHLDKHVCKEEDGKSKFIHPEYHFSFGGSKMWEQSLNYGNILIHPSPRLPHPPMDAVLGVDFILQNFIDKKDIQKLINTPEYKRIVRNSQRRLWMPLMLAAAKHWCSHVDCAYSKGTSLCESIYPMLIK